MPQRSVENENISKRFGPVSKGTPLLVNTIGITTIYTPTPGMCIRLKWLALASPDTNTNTVIANIKLGSNSIYLWPLPAPGAFMHSSVREAAPDEILTITLDKAQAVYVNLDVEEFYYEITR